MSSDKTWSFKMLSLDVIIIALLVWATQRTIGLEVCSQRSGKNCGANTNGYSEFIGRYTFPTTPIETFECKSEEAIAEIKKGIPIVLKNCHFGDITQGWTTEYLRENLISPNLTVYKSATRRFLFYNRESAKTTVNTSWSPPHNVTEMSFVQFLHEMDELESAGNGTKVYLQTGLEKEFLNTDMQDDVLMFNTKWLKEMKEKLSWGRLDVNLFLVGMGGVVTPAHYDIMENLFLQIYGKKRCILFSPENYKFLYPYPVYHPHDRQTQVNFDSPDFERFPKFHNITAVDAVVEPGDVLYIPNYWWHYIESERDSKTISMNFWYLPKSVEDDKLLENDARTTGEHEQDENTFLKDKEIDVNVKRKSKTGEDKIKEKDNSKAEENMATVNETGPVPYTAGELIGLSRDIEAMIGEALGDVTKVGAFLKDMVDGRYDVA